MRFVVVVASDFWLLAVCKLSLPLHKHWRFINSNFYSIRTPANQLASKFDRWCVSWSLLFSCFLYLAANCLPSHIHTQTHTQSRTPSQIDRNREERQRHGAEIILARQFPSTLLLNFPTPYSCYSPHFYRRCVLCIFPVVFRIYRTNTCRRAAGTLAYIAVYKVALYDSSGHEATRPLRFDSKKSVTGEQLGCWKYYCLSIYRYSPSNYVHIFCLVPHIPSNTVCRNLQH